MLLLYLAPCHPQWLLPQRCPGIRRLPAHLCRQPKATSISSLIGHPEHSRKQTLNLPSVPSQTAENSTWDVPRGRPRASSELGAGLSSPRSLNAHLGTSDWVPECPRQPWKLWETCKNPKNKWTSRYKGMASRQKGVGRRLLRGCFCKRELGFPKPETPTETTTKKVPRAG